MPRIQITLPGHFSFSTQVPIRITDLNYGNHVGNDTILSLVHEARVQYLQSMGFSELDAGGTGLIMNAAAIQYKAEVYYGEVLKISVAPSELSASGFNLYYLLENSAGKQVAIAQTGMVCYNYELKKISRMSEALKNGLTGQTSS